MTFADRLRRLMQEQNLTQEAVAERIGVSQPTVSALLAGADPKLSTYRRAVEAFPDLAVAEVPRAS